MVQQLISDAIQAKYNSQTVVYIGKVLPLLTDEESENLLNVLSELIPKSVGHLHGIVARDSSGTVKTVLKKISGENSKNAYCTLELKFILTREVRRRIQKAGFDALTRKEIKPGVCDECSGRIVKRYQGNVNGKVYFHKPACEKCGTKYPKSRSAARIGGLSDEDLRRAYKRPFDI